MDNFCKFKDVVIGLCNNIGWLSFNFGVESGIITNAGELFLALQQVE